MEQKIFKQMALIIAASALCAGLSSCQKDADEKGLISLEGNGTITFGMSFEKVSDDLAVKSSLGLQDEDGNVILMMEEATSDIPSPEQTKATLINGEGDFDSFKVTGYSGTSVYDGITGLTVEKKTAAYPDGHAKWLLGSEKKWPANTDLEFFAWAPADAWSNAPVLTPNVSGTNAATFNYTVADALTQKDIMMAYYKGKGNENTLAGSSAVKDVATMNFSHALSSVTFKAPTGEAEIAALEGITINSITLETIGGTASCTVSFGATSTTYTWGTPTATASYTADFTSSPIAAASLASNETTTFNVIPQTFGEGSPARIVMNITSGGATSDVAYNLYNAAREEGDRGTTWKSGVKYTYIISINAKLDIEIREEFDTITKEDVKIENTGSRDAYMRIGVIANWVDKDGRIVKSCDWMKTGTLTGKAWGNSGDKWVLGDDGWFYYKYGVAKSKSTGVLFAGYTPDSSPMDGLTLSMDVIAQGVDFDKDKANVSAAWGPAAAALLVNSVE